MSRGEIGNQPLRLVQNRFFRGYPGGREIDRFRGLPEAVDDFRPEAWVGSTTRVAYRGEDCVNGGLAEVCREDGSTGILKDYILSAPEAILGRMHAAKFGNDTCILVKLLDAQRQLGLQTHPDREFARSMFHSDYGKTESWYIIGLREDQQEKPYVLLGFKEGVTREQFQALFLQDRLRDMEQCCHKIEVQPGEMYFVDAGVPHAIGPGCFVIEVQEPSDITVGAVMQPIGDEERRRHFIEQTMGCYHYEGRSVEENLNTYRIQPKILSSDAGGKETLLLGMEQTPYFAVTQVDCTGRFKGRETGTFSIAIVIGGAGRLVCDGAELRIKQGDELFLPAGIRNSYWEAEASELSVVISYPPDVL